jgi:hypothetical protein
VGVGSTGVGSVEEIGVYIIRRQEVFIFARSLKMVLVKGRRKMKTAVEAVG